MTTPPTPIYNPDIPRRKDALADSQIDFLNNFSTLYDAFTANHIALDAPSNAGNHTNVQMLEQDKNSEFQTNVDEISIYCKNVAGQTDQIFLRYQGNQTEFQLSAYQIYKLPKNNTSTRFFTILPGNVIVFFGIQNVTLSNSSYPLGLVPGVAKKIITVNLCFQGTTPFNPPRVTIPPVSDNKVISFINLFSANPLFPPPPNSPLYFIVVANL